ncbi:MAG TPA: quinone-dependent dihydroorotate dehydrogenase [Allosphingosinicella sp.]|nr:quinone-dependent dihydroorotate dehydrogenase [Allosphingosinicella sp.]
MALYPLIRPLAFALDAERAHRLTIRALKLLPAGAPAQADPMLSVRVAGLDFPNPVGLAAGFDKDAEVFRQMLGFGFGFVEVGTLTPAPQPGNPKPRLFRLAEDRAAINRLGFNNEGQTAALARLRRRDRRAGLVGVNIGANSDSPNRIADYAAGVRAMLGAADYLTVNISSPNTPGLRALQGKGALEELLAAVIEARGAGPPLFLKVAPDLEAAEVDFIAKAAIDHKIDALIVANSTISRPVLQSRHRREAGGLSGAPMKALALERLRDFASATGGALPLIAAGGIENGVDAFERIRAGASLVQLYTALVYQGPGMAHRINAELRRLLRLHGFASLTEAVGSDDGPNRSGPRPRAAGRRRPPAAPGG